MEQTQELLALDFWQDTVMDQGKNMPTGTIGCEALNISDATVQLLSELYMPLNILLGSLIQDQYQPIFLVQARSAVMQILELIKEESPFRYLDMTAFRKAVEEGFSDAAFESFCEIKKVLGHIPATPDVLKKYELGFLFEQQLKTFAHLPHSLALFRTAMIAFAETMDRAKNRDPDGLAAIFAERFPNELTMDNAQWLAAMNVTPQYIGAIHPKLGKPILVKRMHYQTIIGMLRADLFEGLAVGHAPKKCANCGRWFLTRNARLTKYCGGYDPDSGKKWGCRQVSNRKGGEHRELAPDHPLKQIYRKRLNTINQGIRRSSLDQELGEMMKNLAKNKLRRAIRDIPYAQNHYEKEMEQKALKKEAMARLGR